MSCAGQGQKRVSDPPGTGVTDSYELGIAPWFILRVESTANC